MTIISFLKSIKFKKYEKSKIHTNLNVHSTSTINQFYNIRHIDCKEHKLVDIQSISDHHTKENISIISNSELLDNNKLKKKRIPFTKKWDIFQSFFNGGRRNTKLEFMNMNSYEDTSSEKLSNRDLSNKLTRKNSNHQSINLSKDLKLKQTCNSLSLPNLDTTSGSNSWFSNIWSRKSKKLSYFTKNEPHLYHHSGSGSKSPKMISDMYHESKFKIMKEQNSHKQKSLPEEMKSFRFGEQNDSYENYTLYDEYQDYIFYSKRFPIYQNLIVESRNLF